MKRVPVLTGLKDVSLSLFPEIDRLIGREPPAFSQHDMGVAEVCEIEGHLDDCPTGWVSFFGAAKHVPRHKCRVKEVLVMFVGARSDTRDGAWCYDNGLNPLLFDCDCNLFWRGRVENFWGKNDLELVLVPCSSSEDISQNFLSMMHRFRDFCFCFIGVKDEIVIYKKLFSHLNHGKLWRELSDCRISFIGLRDAEEVGKLWQRRGEIESGWCHVQ